MRPNVIGQQDGLIEWLTNTEEMTATVEVLLNLSFTCSYYYKREKSSQLAQNTINNKTSISKSSVKIHHAQHIKLRCAKRTSRCEVRVEKRAY